LPGITSRSMIDAKNINSVDLMKAKRNANNECKKHRSIKNKAQTAIKILNPVIFPSYFYRFNLKKNMKFLVNKKNRYKSTMNLSMRNTSNMIILPARYFPVTSLILLKIVKVKVSTAR
jgi:hypothetical protein